MATRTPKDSFRMLAIINITVVRVTVLEATEAGVNNFTGSEAGNVTYLFPFVARRLVYDIIRTQVSANLDACSRVHPVSCPVFPLVVLLTSSYTHQYPNRRPPRGSAAEPGCKSVPPRRISKLTACRSVSARPDVWIGTLSILTVSVNHGEARLVCVHS